MARVGSTHWAPTTRRGADNVSVPSCGLFYASRAGTAIGTDGVGVRDLSHPATTTLVAHQTPTNDGRSRWPTYKAFGERHHSKARTATNSAADKPTLRPASRPGNAARSKGDDRSAGP